MPTRPMLFNSFMKSLAISGCVLVGGCDLFGAPPTQLEADIKATGEIRDKDELAKQFVQYLQIKGLSEKQLRVVEKDEKTHSYSLRLVGKEAVPAALLDQLAKGLAAADKERHWPATLTVNASAELDQFLKTTKREFPLVLGWKNAEVDAYVVSRPESVFDLVRKMQAGGAAEKKTVLCMLSFAPDGGLPKLEGTHKEVFGKDRPKTMMELRAGLGDMPYQAPHAVTFEQAALAEAFGEPLVKDGKLMFEFAEIVDAQVTEIGKTLAVDHEGRTQKQCQGKLEEKSAAINQLIVRARLLSQVQSIGPVRLVPLAAAK